MITLRQLEIFVEVVRAGSFRRCGESLGMSQVSVSEHVRALEDRLGTLLFERRAGGAPLITKKGKIAHARIVDIIASVGDLMTEMDDGKSKKARRLSVSMHSFLVRDLPPVLREFSVAHPTIDVLLDSEPHTRDELLDMVARRVLDIAYFFALDDIPVPGTRFVRYEPLSIFVGNDHPLAGEMTVETEVLAKLPGIQLTARDPLRDPVDRAFAAIGLSERCIGIETDDFGRILGSAQRGLGYVCLFDATAQDSARTLGLNKLVLTRQLPALEVLCATRSTASKDPLLISFIDAVERGWEHFAVR